MKRFELEAQKDPRFTNWCRDFAYSTFGEGHQLVLQRLHSFVVMNIKYVPDAYNETITAPGLILQTRRGDCDDMSLFIKAVCHYLRIPAQYVLLGKKPNEFTHIVVEACGIIIDGANRLFNDVPQYYQYRKTA